MGTNLDTARPRGKVREWFARYAPAEVGAVLGALLAAALAQPFGVAAVTAYAGAIGDGVGFYSVLFVRDLRRRPAGTRGRRAATVRGLVMEFGPAELLDSFVIRPLAMYLAARSLGNATAGVIAGKIAADAVFYAVAIAAYELRKHVAGRRRVRARGTARVRPQPVPWPGPTARPGEVLTDVIDLSSVATTPLVLNHGPVRGLTAPDLTRGIVATPLTAPARPYGSSVPGRRPGSWG
jgi:hypothetical protein